MNSETLRTEDRRSREGTSEQLDGSGGEEAFQKLAVTYPEIIDSGSLPQRQFKTLGASNAHVGKVVHRVLQVFCRYYLSLKVSGRENLPASGPFVIAANHSSHLDSVAILSSLDADKAARLRILGARDYFFNRPFKAWFFRNIMNVVPFDRKEDFLSGLSVTRVCVENDCIVLMFPEGTRSVSGRIQKFKVGLGIIACELGVPIVPARLEGTHEALPKGRFVPRPRPVTLSFAPPVTADQFEVGVSSDSRFPLYKSVVKAVRDRIVNLGGGSRQRAD